MELTTREKIAVEFLAMEKVRRIDEMIKIFVKDYSETDQELISDYLREKVELQTIIEKMKS